MNSYSVEISPTKERADRFLESIAFSQTAYELNNGYGIRKGDALSFHEDSALQAFGSNKPENLTIPNGYLVAGVYKNLQTGLDAFIAVNPENGQIRIAIAGTNGFGSDNPDTKEDLINLGASHAKELFENATFREDFNEAVKLAGGIESINKVIICGQSLGGAVAALLGKLIALHDQTNSDVHSSERFLITPEKIAVVAINSPGSEYASKILGFSDSDNQRYKDLVESDRLVVVNEIDNSYDIVSQTGGGFDGTNWLLPVQDAKTAPERHRIGGGIYESINRKKGDLTQIKAGDPPKVDHATLSQNLAWLDQNIPIANNYLSLTWSGYVAMLFSKPGEGANGMSAALQSFAGFPKPLADFIGAISEITLRYIPVANIVPAVKFLFGSYLTGQTIGSSPSSLPPFDADANFGKVQQGWSRSVIQSDNAALPPVVIDTDTRVGTTVTRFIDGRTMEVQSTGMQILTHPEAGMAVINADGTGLLFLKSRDEVTGDYVSSTVSLDSSTKLTFDKNKWIARRVLDASSGLVEQTVYQGRRATLTDVQISSDTALQPGNAEKIPFTYTVPADGPRFGADMHSYQYVVPVSPGHIQLVSRDEDRRLLQTVDIDTKNQNRTESVFRDGNGNITKTTIKEQLNQTTERTRIFNADGEEIESTVVQLYRYKNEYFTLIDHISEDGTHTLTTLDKNNNQRSIEVVPIDAKPAELVEAMREELHQDVASFLTALRQKDTAGMILGVARITLDYARSERLVTQGYDTVLGDVSSGLALINALHSLQSGDTLANLGGAVGFLNSANYFSGRLLNSNLLNSDQAKFLGSVGAVLSIASLTKLGNMLEAGQFGSASATIASSINAIGYLSGGSPLMGSGAIIAINPIAMVVAAYVLDSIFGDDDPPPPPPVGTAHFVSTNDGRLSYQISNANALGRSILKKQIDELLPKLEAQIAAANEHITDSSHQLRLIASRMPAVHISSWPSYSGNGVSNYFFAIEQANPMRDDPNWMGIARQDLVNNYGQTLLLPEAIVQQWEVEHLQAKFGSDEVHWQTESAWLRGQSPIEKERSRLQTAYEQATQEWKAVSSAKLVASSLTAALEKKGNVSLLPTLADRREAAQKAMEAAKTAVNTYNETFPADPAMAARVTAAEEAQFARAHAARETVALQWTKLIAIDIGNDGISISDMPGNVGSDLDSLRHQQVARFDVDGDGFREASQWIAPSEAILGIDRSGNGALDDGSELFNAADTPFDQHGIPSLAYFDANGDGLVNRDDPAFRQLRLWVDLDGDGSSGALEVFDMDMRPVALAGSADPAASRSPMAIESIDLRNHKVIYADGGTSTMETVSLLSHVQGLLVVHDQETNNLNVLHEDGLRENFITLADDMGALAELESSAIAPERKAQLESLARRYGLNPNAAEFSSIVRSLRSASTELGQDTVIYFGDDDVWIDPSIREHLTQMRISFRRLGDASQSIAGNNQLARLGSAPEAQAADAMGLFDDRWVASRKLSASDVISDPVLPPAAPPATPEQLVLPADVYSLLEVAKGAQDGGMVARQVIPISDSAQPDLPPKTVSIFVTQQPVAGLPGLDLSTSEDSTLSLSFAQLEQQAAQSSAATAGQWQLLGVRSSTHGIVKLDDAQKRLLFQPEANYAGAADLTVVLADAQGLIYEQRINVQIKPINDAPVSLGEKILAAEDVPLLIDSAVLLANDKDPEGDPIRITGIGRVALGKAELLGNGQIHYTPPSDQYDVADTVEYFVSDSSGATSIAKIRIALSPVNDAPTVVSERVINAREDQVLRISAPLLLANDLDADTDARIGSSALRITAVGSAEHGEVRLEGEQITFRPESDYNGAAAFSYTVTDATGRSTVGRSLIRIDPVTDLPLVANEHIDALEDEPLIIDTSLLLQNDIDPDILRGEKQSLSVVALDQAEGGTVQLRDGQVIFTPEANRSGRASFRYTVSDGAGGLGQGIVEISLAEVNDAPIVPPLHYKIQEDQLLSIALPDLLSNAIDVDDEHAQLYLAGIGKVTGGSVTQADGKLIFTPDKDYFGIAQFEYSIADAESAITNSVCVIDINNINDAPLMVDGVRLQPIADEDQEVHISESALLQMFIDVDGDPVSIAPNSFKALDTSDNVVFDEQRRELIFRAARNANGERRLSFAVTDGQTLSQPATVSIQLRPVNDVPEVRAVGFQMLEDGGEINPSKSAWTYLSHDLLLSGASDADGDSLSVISASAGHTTGNASSQAVQIANDPANRRVAIMAPLNYTGSVEFEFAVSDGHGGLVTQKAIGMVAAVNDAPLFTSQPVQTTSWSIMGSQRITYKWQLSAWDPDEKSPLKFAVVKNPLHGSASSKVLSNKADPVGGIRMNVEIVVQSMGTGSASAADSMQFSATDSVGAKSTTDISFTTWYGDPIAIDLDNDGLEFTDLDHSQVSFDIDGSGTMHRMAWVGSDDAILAWDWNQDGQINRIDEIAFWSHISSQPLPGRSDLQALQQTEFDSNQDGVFDAADGKWSQFRLWRDINGNGKSDDGELQTLQAAHIKQLYLNGNVLNRAEGPDVVVRGYTRAVTDDDRLLQAADVWLNMDDGSKLPNKTPTVNPQATLMKEDQLTALLAQLANTPTGSNHAPLLYGYIPTQYADEGEIFHLDISPNLFIDPDPNEPLEFSAMQADGSPLPQWLRFDTKQLRFEGTPAAADASHLQIMLRATDPQQSSTDAWFNLLVNPASPAAAQSAAPYQNTLFGDAGDDEYSLAPGDGWHALLDSGGSDLIRIDFPSLGSDLRFHRQADDLLISVPDTGDGMTVSDWYRKDASGAYPNQIERFQLSDGRMLQVSDVDNLIVAQSQGGAAQTSQFWR